MTNRLCIDEGTTAICAYCDQRIQLDVTVGGGDPSNFYAWDWGSEILGEMPGDFGCDQSPETNEDGCGGHSPRWETLSHQGRPA